MWRLFLDDEGVIGRRQWWLGTLTVLAALWLVNGLVYQTPTLWRVEPGVLVFFSLAALIPFHALNVKRLRDRRRPEWLALVAALPPAIAALSVAVRPATGMLGAVDMVVGVSLLLVAAWMILDLGLGGSKPQPVRSFLHG